MTSMSSTSRGTRWPVVVLAVIGAIAVAPIVFGLLIAGVALAIGLLGALLKAAAVVFIIWAVVMVLKGLFGGGHQKPAKTLTPSTIEHISPASVVDPEAEMEREKREHLAQLDRELEIAVAQTKKDEGSAQP